MTAMGVAKLACCQPEADSFAKVTEASSVPVLVQRYPACGPMLVELL